MNSLLVAAVMAGGGGLFSAGPLAAAQEQSASLSGEVGAGERHVTRLRNLPKGANLKVEVGTDGNLRVLVLNADQFESLPNSVRPVMTGSGDRRIRFELVIPATGSYFLVVDNSEADEARSFSLHVQASVGDAGTAVDSNRAADGDRDGEAESRALAELERFQSNLRQTFIFDELAFRIDSCGQPGAASRGRTVTLCLEVGPLAMQQLGDAAKARDVVLFIMLREVGRAMLTQWEFPAADSEDVVDRFAVVLHLMYGQEARLDSVVEFLETFDAGSEAASGLIDVQPRRAENLKQWRNDPGIIEQWQPFLIERIQTATLRVLASQPRDWTDVEAINRELARR